MLSEKNETSEMPDYHKQGKIFDKKISRLQQKLQCKEQECRLLLIELHKAQDAYVTEINKSGLLIDSHLGRLQTLNLKLAEELHKVQESYTVEVNKTQLVVDGKLNVLHSTNITLLNQLHKTQEAFLETANLTTISVRKPFYGAKEAIKNDLPYRMGATMVNHSKSAKKLIFLPFALIKEYSKFKKGAKSANRLPSPDMYADQIEAEKVKKHLSYKLGDTLVNGMRSPKKAIKVPFRLYQEIKVFNKSKST